LDGRVGADKLVWMWKEMVVVPFAVLSQDSWSDW